MLTEKVLVSPTFPIPDKLLKQIGEHRQQLKIRQDHHVPFAVVTGLTQKIQIAPTKGVKLKPYYRLPLPVRQEASYRKWQVPLQVREKTISLCKALDNQKVTIYWERMEYKYLVEDDGLLWPETVTHKQLILKRNRYPVVPGFCLKERKDLAAPPALPSPINPKSTLRRRIKGIYNRK